MFAFPNINPVAVSIGPIDIRWYAIAYIIGFIGAWWYATKLVAYRDKHDQNVLITKNHLEDFMTWAIIGVVAGGRLGYVLFYKASYYLWNPLEILMVWNGGMSFHGGMLGLILAAIFFSHKNKISLFGLTDIIACVAPIGLLFGRIANFVNGELYGRMTNHWVGIVFPNGGPIARHPSQLYEAALEGLLLFLIIMLAFYKSDTIRRTSGTLSGLFLIGYGLARFTVEFFREPDAHLGYIINWMTMGQILCLPMILGGVVLIIYARKAAKHTRI